MFVTSATLSIVMQVRSFFIFLYIILPAISFAQGTYWQQQVNTKINVTLDDQKHLLRGYETITYSNNSPDTLHHLYIHLWANAYKHDHTPFAEQQYQQGKTNFYYAKTSQRGYIDSLNFMVDGNSLSYSSAIDTPDISKIQLLHPLPPGGTVTISTPFRVKIPKVFSRLGHAGQAYYISQWFPKPAVYDRNGWHPMPYLDQGEFYSEYGSYDVKITLPKNYVVMATGNLQNTEETAWLDSLASLKIPYWKNSRDSFPPSSNETKTLHFIEENVHDFAWFADKRFIIRKDSFRYEKTSFPITIYTAALPSTDTNWNQCANHLKDALSIYGKYVGQYPYKTIKAVQGILQAGGGMEYPTVTIIDKAAGSSKTVLVHEAGHNWFYGILGSNERDFAWMDEGINSFYEAVVLKETEVNVNKITSLLSTNNELVMTSNIYAPIISHLAATHTDQTIAQPSQNFKSINYGLDVYYKTAWYLAWLEDYMGKENFNAAMQAYFQQWKFKHPYPSDFQAILQQYSDKPLAWFFEGLLTSNERIDFAITSTKKEEDNINIKLSNRTSLALPVIVESIIKDSVVAKVTTLPFKGDTTIVMPANSTSFRIAASVADMKTQNNTNNTGIKLRPFFGFNNSYKQKIFWLPAIGYNLNDGFNAGLIFHNITLPENRLKFILMPTLSFKSKSLIGAASLGYSFYPKYTFHEILTQLDFKSYHHDNSNFNIFNTIYARYSKLAPSISFRLKEPSLHSTVKRTILLKGYWIKEEGFDYIQNPIDSMYHPTIKPYESVYGLLRYTHQNTRTFNPFQYDASMQIGKSFLKLMVSAQARIDYHIPNKSLYIRAFVGKFFDLKSNASFTNERYYLNSTSTGRNDYLYDETFFGRSEQSGWTTQQISMIEGGLKVPTLFLASPLGRSDNWLASLNIKSDLPIRFPIRLFLDLSTFSEASKLNPSGDKLLFTGGIELHYKDLCNLYIPLVMSRDFKDYYNTIIVKDKFMRSIMFSIQLDKIQWLKAGGELLEFAE